MAAQDPSGPRPGAAIPGPAPGCRFRLDLELAIRRTGEADLDRLEWFGLYSDHREIIRAAFERQRLGEVAMLVADLDGFPVGQVWIDFRRSGEADSASLWAVRVLPPLQGQGIGARLMRAAERLAAARGREMLTLTVERSNPDARRFYERLGYRTSGAAQDCYSYRTPRGELRQIPLDQWVMTKRLAPEHAESPCEAATRGGGRA
ncbi:GNAT family N-acetyltransferase [Rhodospirillum centenum]|uniref:Acetyltransferase, GNAT family n=1 Tax=Rhodospirillum centenum (strain ATCC 51521 / SW) TaxID=414684 RepID=B6INI1_RHOCS|nr:GNAT family N-acetyltransferase [Rhodospirillum centenum]ACI99078.1 acetyltransferase, GNAT family [Rhodospirillum centenum SW]